LLALEHQREGPVATAFLVSETHTTSYNNMKPSIAVATLVAALPLVQALVIPHNVNSIEAFRSNVNKIDRIADTKHSGHHKGGHRIDEEQVAPFVTSDNAKAAMIEDSYIITFKDDVDDATIVSHHLWVEQVHADNVAFYAAKGQQHALVDSADGGLKHVYDIGPSFRGYAGKFLPDTIEAIRRHPAVAFVEHDSVVKASGFATENGAPWGLARISHRNGLSLGSFNKYLFDDEGGEGVTAYVVDTGINTDHEDFDGRASWGAAFGGNPEIDDNGHGTHCAGTIVGKRYGVAKAANIVAVKVLGGSGSGSMSDVVKGVEFVAASHIRDKNKKGYKGTTANMSLGGGKSPSLDLAVNGAVRAGVHFAVAAGNENQDACNTSPAAAEGAVTVGATALNDDRAYFSNWGKCVDIFAPGVNILSTYIGSTKAVATLSGTSMASPHICGLLSYYLSLQPSTDSEFATTGFLTPAQLKKHLIAFGTKDILTDLDEESPNVLAYNGGGQNLTEFWAPGHSSADVKEEDEHNYSILPVGEAEIAAELNHIAQEAADVLGAIRAGLGLGAGL
jgi:cerevisin